MQVLISNFLKKQIVQRKITRSKLLTKAKGVKDTCLTDRDGYFSKKIIVDEYKHSGKQFHLLGIYNQNADAVIFFAVFNNDELNTLEESLLDIIKKVLLKLQQADLKILIQSKAFYLTDKLSLSPQKKCKTDKVVTDENTILQFVYQIANSLYSLKMISKSKFNNIRKKCIPYKYTDLLPEDIINIRRKAKIPQVILIRCLGINISNLKSWEAGRSKPPASAVMLLKLIARKGVGFIFE